MSSEAQGGRDPLLGAILGGKFRVESLLARGGMGRVYRGTQQPLERPVAIKVLDLGALDPERNEQVEKRFFLEASVCARLTHPNTLTIHDYGAIEGGRGVYIVMELLDGKSLRDVLKEARALPVHRALHIARQICAALIEAHEAGVVHRDLKPGNVVLVNRSGDPDFVKVVDFGLVKQVSARDDSAEVLTSEGSFLGTPRYMAPEQISGEDIDARTDIYSFGVMLYEAIAGQPPFRSRVRGEVPVDLFNAHLKKPPPPFSTIPVAAGVPAEVEAIVMRCLEKDPARRFGSMRELRAALDDAAQDIDDVPTHIRPMPPVTVAGALAEQASSDQITAATRELRPSASHGRRPVVIAASVTGALLLVAALATTLLVVRARGGEGAVEVTAVVTTPSPPAEPRPAPQAVDFTLQVTSAPSGAEVRRAGERLGDTPLTVELPLAALDEEGGRTLTVSLAGHVTEAREVPAPIDGVAAVDVELSALPSPPAEKRPPSKRTKRPRRPPPRQADLDIKVDR